MTLFNPFPGLRPFEPEEDHLFFGRTKELDDLLHRLRTTRFLSVVGGSGSGKSSLVRSGLIPSLYSGFMVAAGSSWRVAVMRPGGDPIGQLSAALDSPGVLGVEGALAEVNRMLLETTLRRGASGLADCVRQARLPAHENVLVVVDQFEELFRFKHNRTIDNARDDAVAFVKLLLAGARQTDVPLYVVLTMRSDFIGDCMEIPGLPEAINEAQYLVPRMTRNELREAIVGPVRVGGGEIAPRLVVRLLNEVGDDPNQLPLLQHALMRAWDHWERHAMNGAPLDLSDYEAIGTMAEALSHHADEAYREIAKADGARGTKTAERIFKALTDTSSDPRGVRRPTSVRELGRISGAGEAEVIALVEHFRGPGRTFLMPPQTVELDSASIVDLSHESLMRCWRRLIDWAEEEKNSAGAYRRLAEAAARHEQGTAGLWRDPELAFGLEWREHSEPTAAWAERYAPGYERSLGFLDASRAERDRHIAEVEKRRERKLRLAIGAAVLLFALAVVMAQLRGAAVEQRLVAQEAQYLSETRLAISQLANQQRVEAEETLWRTPETERNWEWGYLLERSHSRELAAEDGELTDVAFGAAVDRPVIATASAGGAVTLWDPHTAAHLFTLEACRLESGSTGLDVNLELSHDGSRVLTVCDADTGPTRIWDTATGELLAEAAEKFEDPAISAGGARVLAIMDNRAEVWDWDEQLDTRRPLTTESLTSAAALSANGKWIATGSESGEIAIWDAATGVQQIDREAAGGPIKTLVFSPDSERLASGAGKEERIWKLSSSAPPGLDSEATLPHDSPVSWAAFASDGRHLVTADFEGTTRVWAKQESDEPAWAESASLEGRARRVAFNPRVENREVLVEAREEAVLWNWRTGTSRDFPTLRKGITQAAFSADGRQVLTRFPGEQVARIWESDEARLDTRWASLKRERVLAADGTGAAFRVITALEFRGSPRWGFRLWEIGREEPLAQEAGHEGIVRAAAFSSDGKRLITSSQDSTIVWSSSENDNWGRSLTLDVSRVEWAAFSPDGRRIVAAVGEVVKLWDGETGAELATLSGHTGRVFFAAFGPDGRRVITASGDGTARLWDARTGAMVRTFVGHEGRVVFAALGPEGRIAVTGGEDRTARLWDPKTGEELATLEGHEAAVIWAGFSSDRTRVVTASKDDTVRVWSTDGTELVSLTGFDELKSVRFGPEARELLIVSADLVDVRRVLPFRADQLPGDASRPWEERLATFENQLRP